ncbi:MAG: cadmium-translocating P-type ATPase [Sphingobacteriales bacterium 17-39-43]|uniref:heavy metal translocating P-type ATPase n=1 Tax=Daejeonella sp. TaxID=2805397 RepID=UPI000BC91D8D|nr:heavy metal translocating P-type ATPase [Daejeonella sp.]OYZ31666.1 MAG: cadmium-translocating P-type ATPase [Sphingobacteriales bacterium 16-39-50]OZA25061.1 MAG: cadmium-translocating P-type ATPase [Sphingobacteriales bacterium 17-39-43]OZA59559.1 MAG: cadmium-translocating P-type ATPase [Sphingobacteriales bacterium 39-40-5]HQS50577.1 heavy metal translocating P-type ATPase [Daejeonella sp.]HQT23647.1 heavy metal translocating P-type ATPase [Daejeonella sp.]
MKSNTRHTECCSTDIDEQPGNSGNQKIAQAEGHKHGTLVAGWRSHWNLLLSFLILLVMLVLEYGFNTVFPDLISLLIFGTAYLLAGWTVLDLAFRKLKRFDIFNEFFLMSVATIGAFLIGEYSEGVAVMVFYSVGEWFQDSAVNRAKRSIKALLDIRPDEVTVIREGTENRVDPLTVELDEAILIKPGEKVALDGELITENASFNTAALTGESKPDTKYKGETILAGMINLNTVAVVRVKALFRDSKLSRILEMVQDATARKSQTQLFISKFAKVYTPIVFFLAVAVCFLPFFFVEDYNFNTWFYRSLVFLVISCPCALVVSIPLGYFGGIGLASRHGILFKGGNFLDVMTKINAVIMDKTGTLTKGVFKVQEVVADGIDKQELIRLAAILEKSSTHPIALAITEYAGESAEKGNAEKVEEIPGHGLNGIIEGKEILAGNLKLLKKFSVSYPDDIGQIVDTIVVIAISNRYAGYITIADEIKEDAVQAINDMHRLNVKTVMLSGDKQSVVDQVAKKLGIDTAYGDLLPEDKVKKVEELKNSGLYLAFVGDGVNDAPVVALADAGIAMGGLGSDATIETADVVIQNDHPSKIVSAILIGKITRNVVWQNIILAMVVKIIVLGLGAGGVATLWEAVIADVGVALLAIANAVRIQKMQL